MLCELSSIYAMVIYILFLFSNVLKRGNLESLSVKNAIGIHASRHLDMSSQAGLEKVSPLESPAIICGHCQNSGRTLTKCVCTGQGPGVEVF